MPRTVPTPKHLLTDTRPLCVTVTFTHSLRPLPASHISFLWGNSSFITSQHPSSSQLLVYLFRFHGRFGSRTRNGIFNVLVSFTGPCRYIFILVPFLGPPYIIRCFSLFTLRLIYVLFLISTIFREEGRDGISICPRSQNRKSTSICLEDSVLPHWKVSKLRVQDFESGFLTNIQLEI